MCALVAAAVLVLLLGLRRAEPPRAAAIAKPAEKPWLSRDAAAQIIAPGGGLGPLFADVELGRPVPPDARARIAEFARKNHVAIDLEVIDDELVAVRFDVTFGGCCGYEGADVLALRLGRRSTSDCCGCGNATWMNDWSFASEDGVTVRASVRVNRLVARWERTATLADVLSRADELIGRDAATTRKAARDRWIELGAHRHLLEVPYPFSPFYDFGAPVPLANRDDLGFNVLVERGRIEHVMFALHGVEDMRQLRARLRAQWGRPQRREDDTWTWQLADRSITAQLDDMTTLVEISQR